MSSMRSNLFSSSNREQICGRAGSPIEVFRQIKRRVNGLRKAVLGQALETKEKEMMVEIDE